MYFVLSLHQKHSLLSSHSIVHPFRTTWTCCKKIRKYVKNLNHILKWCFRCRSLRSWLTWVTYTRFVDVYAGVSSLFVQMIERLHYLCTEDTPIILQKPRFSAIKLSRIIEFRFFFSINYSMSARIYKLANQIRPAHMRLEFAKLVFWFETFLKGNNNFFYSLQLRWSRSISRSLSGVDYDSTWAIFGPRLLAEFIRTCRRLDWRRAERSTVGKKLSRAWALCYFV